MVDYPVKLCQSDGVVKTCEEIKIMYLQISLTLLVTSIFAAPMTALAIAMWKCRHEFGTVVPTVVVTLMAAGIESSFLFLIWGRHL